MTPNEGQILFITAIIVPLLIQGLKLVLAWQGKEMSRGVVAGVSVVVSLLLALWWWMPKLPAGMTDPMEILTSVLTATTAIVGGATLIYNIILAKVFELTGLSKDQMLARAANKTGAPE